MILAAVELVSSLAISFFLSTPGKVATSGVVAAYAADAHLAKKARARYRREQYLGLSRQEDAAHLDRHGMPELLFPASLAQEGMEDLEVLLKTKLAGRYVFKIGEWNDLWKWLRLKMKITGGDYSELEGRDGYWLIEVGRRRWYDAECREQALTNSRNNVELWRQLKMWNEQDTM